MTSDPSPCEGATATALPAAVRDPARVAAVNALHPSPEHDEQLGELAHLASLLCDTSMAAVTLLDDQCQQLRGRAGIDSVQMSVTDAFCAHAIDTPAEVMVVADTSQDARFADNPMVIGPPFVRFYAGAPLVDGAGHVLGTLCVFDEQPRELEAKAREALAVLSRQAATVLHQRATAHHDPLTGLLDRSAFDSWLARRGPEEAVGLVLIDLDHFTGHNVGLGPGAGDQLLRAVAGRLRRAVADDDLLARVGGDQFVVATSWTGDGDDAPSRLRRAARSVLDAPFEVGDHEAKLTASAGLITASTERDSATVLHQAALAVREAKRLGGAQVVGYDPTLGGHADRRWRLQQALDGAAQRGQLWLAYQPLVDLGTRDLVAVEALVRWHHPEYGSISPEELLELSESGGQTRALARWLFDEALSALSDWRAAHPSTDLRLHVNLSASQLDDTEAVTSLAEQLQRRGLPGDALTIEITEQTAMLRPYSSASRLHALRALGVRVALDEFGVGVSSLQRLSDLALDQVKLGRSFLHGLERHGRAAPLLDGVIGLLRGLDLTVIAAGIETDTQAGWLTQRGVSLGQGWLFGEPMPDTEIRAVLDAEHRGGPSRP